jgi:vacuolar-type H+-ATPase subunit E/Vma4
MGVQEIVAMIAREADEEAARLVADARTRAATLCEEAESTAQADVRTACDRAEPGIAAAATRRVNAARLRLLERRSAIEASRIEAVMTAAGSTLHEIADGADPSRWKAALERLAIDALETIGPGALIRVRASDATLLATVVATRAGRLEPLTDQAAPAGLWAIAPDQRITVDSTLAARLGRARIRLAEEIGRVLGLAEWSS